MADYRCDQHTFRILKRREFIDCDPLTVGTTTKCDEVGISLVDRVRRCPDLKIKFIREEMGMWVTVEVEEKFIFPCSCSCSESGKKFIGLEN